MILAIMSKVNGFLVSKMSQVIYDGNVRVCPLYSFFSKKRDVFVLSLDDCL